MKTQRILFAFVFCFLIGNVSVQVKDIKSHTNKESLESSKIEALLHSKTFEFVANSVYPTSGPRKKLSSSIYTVSFTPEMIISNLPFYGRAYSGAAMNPDKGMGFEGKPENFHIEKKKNYRVNLVVSDGDNYKLSLSVNNSGHATLIISSGDRGTISYRGEIIEFSE